MPEENKPVMGQNFIHDFIDEDIAQGGQYAGMKVHTRFPPEPNGYLHIGHAKAIFIDFGTAEKYGGLCNLRMDDTNPTKEDVEYVDAIQEDIHWLGYDWGDRFYFASDSDYACKQSFSYKLKQFVNGHILHLQNVLPLLWCFSHLVLIFAPGILSDFRHHIRCCLLIGKIIVSKEKVQVVLFLMQFAAL